MGNHNRHSEEPTHSKTPENPVKPSQEKRASKWAGIKHFKPNEFTCKCDGLCDRPDAISSDLVERLDKVRELIGMPITVTSGTRCERHNRKVGGSPQSAHLPKDGISYAADVKCPGSRFRFAFLTAALPLFSRVGVGKDFIHVDVDPHLDANLMWLYGP